jgi:predicted ArsR family transcriptional regulator
LVSRVFERRRQRRVEQCQDQLTGKTLDEKVAGLDEILDSEGYMAGVDKLPGDSYRLTLHSCAIWAVASRFGPACATELEFIQEVLPEAEVTRVAHKVAGAHVCAFEIRPRGTKPRSSHPKALRDLTSA